MGTPKQVNAWAKHTRSTYIIGSLADLAKEIVTLTSSEWEPNLINHILNTTGTVHYLANYKTLDEFMNKKQGVTK